MPKQKPAALVAAQAYAEQLARDRTGATDAIVVSKPRSLEDTQPIVREAALEPIKTIADLIRVDPAEAAKALQRQATDQHRSAGELQRWQSRLDERDQALTQAYQHMNDERAKLEKAKKQLVAQRELFRRDLREAQGLPRARTSDEVLADREESLLQQAAGNDEMAATHARIRERVLAGTPAPQTLIDELTVAASEIAAVHKNAVRTAASALDTADAAGRQLDRIGRPDMRIATEKQILELVRRLCSFLSPDDTQNGKARPI